MKKEILTLLNSTNIDDRVLAVNILYEEIGAKGIKKIIPDAMESRLYIPRISHSRDIYYKDINVSIRSDSISWYRVDDPDISPMLENDYCKVLRYE